MLFAALALAAPSPPATLDPLQFLVGHCWRTTLKDGPTDTHCFTAMDGGRIRDRHAVRKDGKVIYTGESLFSLASGAMHYSYSGSTGFHLEGPMHAAGGKIVFDDIDKTGTTTFWRQIDAGHYEDVTEVTPSAPPELVNSAERKLFELVADEKP